MNSLRTSRISPALSALALGCALSISLSAGTGYDTSRIGAQGPGKGGELPPGQVPLQLEGVGIDEHLGKPIDLNLTFIGEDGYPVPLKNFFHTGRPVIIDLVYYSCPMLCNLILNGQVEAMRDIDWTPGTQFDVVTISFNPMESFDLARQKKQGYMASYDRPGATWHFMTDDHGNAKRLAEEMGFHYRYDAKQEQFAHPSAIMVLTPEGRIARYLYGIKYRSRDLKFSLAEASAGRYTNALDKLILFCYHYDPQANAYVLFAGRFMRAGGALTVLILGFFLWRMIRTERSRSTGRSFRERPA
ncbi:MAG TPA: SCO family protein [Bryobacteraceae bacterium]|jgi:protein SCO1/2